MTRALFSIALFSSAALLFLVEPMVAKMLLPSLGGAPAVWNTCLVFFQAALLGGYFYAHVITRGLAPRRQIVLHAVLLAAAAVALPIGVRGLGAPPASSNPIPWLLATLALSVGLPFAALAATTPLVQSWFAGVLHDGSDPYTLYSASNLGSFTGLLSYPFLIERTFDLDAQSRLWTIGYGIVSALILSCAAVVWKAAPTFRLAEPTVHRNADPPSSRVAWVVLAMIPASLTLSVTTYISTDVAAIPLVWVLPLSLYLLSLVVAFARPRVGRLTRRLLPIVVLPPIICVLTNSTRPAWLQIPAHLLTFFVVSLACHQALAQGRPERDRLPEFYLWVALGGAAGGLFNALVAPLLFRTPVEYPVGLLLACYAGTRTGSRERLTWTSAAAPILVGAMVPVLAALTARFGWPASALATHGVTFGPPLLVAALLWVWPLRYVLALAATLVAGAVATRTSGLTLDVQRSFFGIHRVMLDDGRRFHQIVDGATIHGIQATDPAKRRECLAYYAPVGPAGQVFATLRGAREPHDVAIVGLGAGALTCYATAGQRWTFFEIDPVVVAIANNPSYFTYLADNPASTRVVLGDGRLSLTHLSGERYDLIVLDAFSSDAIPVHLLTREALHLYLQRLTPHGRILFQISNLYLSLRPVIARLAEDAGVVALAQRYQVSEEKLVEGVFPSEWVLMARNREDLGDLARDPRWDWARSGDAALWTDRSSNIFQAVEWRGWPGRRDSDIPPK